MGEVNGYLQSPVCLSLIRHVRPAPAPTSPPRTDIWIESALHSSTRSARLDLPVPPAVFYNSRLRKLPGALGSQGLCPRAVRPPNSGGVRQGQRVPFCPSGRSDRYREWPIEHRRSQVCTCCTMKLLRSLYVQHFGPPVALNAFHNVRTRELIRLANCKLHEIALLGVAPDSMRPPL